MSDERLCDRCSRRLVYRTKINLDPGARQLIIRIQELESDVAGYRAAMARLMLENTAMKSRAKLNLFTKN